MLTRRHGSNKVANIYHFADHLMANRLTLTHRRNAAHETDIKVTAPKDEWAHKCV